MKMTLLPMAKADADAVPMAEWKWQHDEELEAARVAKAAVQPLTRTSPRASRYGEWCGL
jgi:hypothetical protein